MAKTSKPKIPSTYTAGDTTFKLTQETFFYPKSPKVPRSKKLSAPKPYVQLVKVVGQVPGKSTRKRK